MNKHFNIADLFEQVADVVPEREALVCGGDRITYAELDKKRAQMAAAHESREVRAQKKQDAILKEVEVAVKACEQARQALEAQEKLLVSLQGEHARLWESANAAKALLFQDRMREMIVLCEAKKPSMFPPASHDAQLAEM